MEYRFARKLYEILGRIHLNKYQDTAYEMIEYGKKHLGNARFSKYYFNSALRALRLMRRKYKDVKNLPESDSEIETQLMGINEVRRDQCIFLTFLIMDCGMPLQSDDYSEEKYPYVVMLNSLLRAAGREILINSCMDNAILYFALAARRPWKTWVDMQAEWSRREEKDKALHDKYQEWRRLTYGEFKVRVQAGMDEEEYQTQQTYIEEDKKINEIINSYIHEADWNRANPGTGAEDSESISVMDVFPESVRKVMENAEWRRTWYLYRMILMTVDCQIDHILRLRENWRENSDPAAEQKFEQAVKSCWLKTNYGEILRRILNWNDAEQEEALLRAYFGIRYLTVENISRTFNEALTDVGESVFVRPQYRFFMLYPERPESFLSKEEKTRYHRIVGACFGSEKKLPTAEEWEYASAGGIRNARLFKNILAGETKTTREMLLLTALVAKSQGCRGITEDYVQSHVLKNCRFDVETNDDKPFDCFFMEAFADISSLRTYAQKLELKMLQEGKGAVFYNILMGREV